MGISYKVSVKSNYILVCIEVFYLFGKHVHACVCKYIMETQIDQLVFRYAYIYLQRMIYNLCKLLLFQNGNLLQKKKISRFRNFRFIIRDKRKGKDFFLKINMLSIVLYRTISILKSLFGIEEFSKAFDPTKNLPIFPPEYIL